MTCACAGCWGRGFGPERDPRSLETRSGGQTAAPGRQGGAARSLREPWAPQPWVAAPDPSEEGSVTHQGPTGVRRSTVMTDGETGCLPGVLLCTEPCAKSLAP